ncbi:MAG: hypothetical protein ACLVB1_06585 [Blautia obeum]
MHNRDSGGIELTRIFEILTLKVCTGRILIVLYNINGYYDRMKACFNIPRTEIYGCCQHGTLCVYG